jgi:hypothetical protein
MIHVLSFIQEAAEQEGPAAAGGGISSRTFVLALMVLLPAVSTLMVVVGGLRLKALLKRIPKISSKAHLEALRSEHRLHSTMALLIRAFLGIANVLFFVDLFILDGPITDILYSIVPSLVSIGVSLPFRGAEQQANELPCATEELRKEWVEIRQE